ncbi:nucleoside diphosphate kinase [Gilbertella persicaria]|uniref:nucleoside diphosphate kinase n=1 Tax=Gilbertella persicaria TaxID=101096 RepID=UPI00221F2C32|nr:nucleoside diphosphate kinase [Gilbertella persicaria]KAI8065359.1 nucleoside diphosphate kinase [Gilbertella persicaria]
MLARAAARFAVRPATASLKTRTFATASRATAAAGSQRLALATAGVVTASALSYAYLQKPVSADSKPVAGIKGTASERTFIAIKPDGVQRGLIGKIITRFEDKGYKLVGMKAIAPSKELAERHYEDLKSRPFFSGLVNYITSGTPVIAMVWEGPDVIRTGRVILGATDPLKADPSTIRGQYCVSVGRNIIHGSDSFESAEKEIGMWFSQANELIDWKPANVEWVQSEN